MIHAKNSEMTEEEQARRASKHSKIKSEEGRRETPKNTGAYIHQVSPDCLIAGRCAQTCQPMTHMHSSQETEGKRETETQQEKEIPTISITLQATHAYTVIILNNE